MKPNTLQAIQEMPLKGGSKKNQQLSKQPPLNQRLLNDSTYQNQKSGKH
jgi:hypothetical protein